MSAVIFFGMIAVAALVLGIFTFVRVASLSLPTEANLAVDAWNLGNPIGTPISFLNDAGAVQFTKTRSGAWSIGGNQAVILIEGRTGFVLLDRCTPFPPKKSGGES